MRRIIIYVPPEPPEDLRAEMLHLFRRIWRWLPADKRRLISRPFGPVVDNDEDPESWPDIVIAHILESVAQEAHSLGLLSEVAYRRILGITWAVVEEWTGVAR